jgi:peptidoglycan hydrolase-like protein with peptidoglycan-binding domain
MLRIIKEGCCARLAVRNKQRTPSLSGFILVLTIALLAGVQSSPAFAEDWGTWLQKKGSELYEDSKKAVKDYSMSSEKGDEPAKNQGTAVPKPKQPQYPSADAPRYDKPWITEIQTHLTKLGYQPGPIDGAFGYQSKVAIRNYQQQHGLQVTGLPTPSLMQALRGEPQVASTGLVKPVAKEMTPQELSYYPVFAESAGTYAGLADSCKDPAAAQVRADFEARTAMLPANSIPKQFTADDYRKHMMLIFKSKYDQSKLNYDQKSSLGDCARLVKYKHEYERWMKAIGATPVGGIATQVNAPQSTPKASQTRPDSQLAYLAKYAGEYAAYADHCNRPNTGMIRTHFNAALAGESPEHQKILTQSFDNYYQREQSNLQQRACSEHILTSKKRTYEGQMKQLGLTPAPDSGTQVGTSPAKPPAAPAAPGKATSGGSNPPSVKCTVLDQAMRKCSPYD